MASLNPVLPLVFLLLTTFYHLGEGRDPHTFLVGGSVNGWKVPESSDNMTLIHWAESQRFLVGDSLEFDFDINKDWVLQVTKENYEKCITEKAKEYKHNRTVLKLDVSGPHYFISGAPGNCLKGEKLIVVVQSTAHPPTSPKPAPPTPKPIPATAPPTPSKPSASPTPATAAPPTPSKPSTSPPAPAPANNAAVGFVAGSGIFWAFVTVIGLAWA